MALPICLRSEFSFLVLVSVFVLRLRRCFRQSENRRIASYRIVFISNRSNGLSLSVLRSTRLIDQPIGI